ncbi:MAG: aldose epimerase [Oscillatoriaceae cyanobacterium]
MDWKTYTISDPGGAAEIDVVPDRGGIITRWRICGEDILYLDEERFTNPELSVRGGVPILFPICGNLPDNTYTYHQQTYTLKQHGFARDLPWEVAATTPAGSITLVLTSNDHTQSVYPFDFRIVYTYQVQGDTLTIRQEYTNLGAEPMPFSAGLHPYFTVKDKSSLQFEIPSTAYLNQRTGEMQPFTGNFDFDLDEIDVAFGNLTGTSAIVTDNSRRLQVLMESDPSHSYLVFWTVKGKDFYCIEPWTAKRNAINSGENLLNLAPGATQEITARFRAKFF